jgi:hypothetical protein
MGMKAVFAALGGGLALLSACTAATPMAGTMAPLQGGLTRAGSSCGQIQEYEPGTSISGEFTAEDCYAMDGPEREPVDYHQFTVSEQRDVHAVVEAPGLDVQLALLRDDGTVVKTQPYDGSFTSLFTQVPAGTYRISLRSLGGTATGGRLFGRYTLSTSTDRVGFGGCTHLFEVSVGRPVQGEWSVDDCKQPIGSRDVGRYVDYFLLTVPQAREVAVSLGSPGINSYVQLLTREGAQLTMADAFSETGRIVRHLAPGTYVLAVSTSSVNSRETGRYTVSVQ